MLEQLHLEPLEPQQKLHLEPIQEEKLHLEPLETPKAADVGKPPAPAWYSHPIIPIGKFTREQVAKGPQDPARWFLNSIEDLGIVSADVIEGLSTPTNLALIGGLAAMPYLGAPAMMQYLVAGGLAVSQAKAVVEQTHESIQQWKRGDLRESGRQFAEATANGLIALLGARKVQKAAAAQTKPFHPTALAGGAPRTPIGAVLDPQALLQNYEAEIAKGRSAPKLMVNAALRLLGETTPRQGLKALASGSLRERLGQLYRSDAIAWEQLKQQRGQFVKMPPQEAAAFIDRLESGQLQPTPEMQAAHNTLRAIMDSDRAAVQALGTGKLQHFYQDYFPHFWEPKGGVLENVFGRKPLAGPGTFLKPRTYKTFSEGIAAGETPRTWNPIDAVLWKHHEMQRYVAGQLMFQDAKAQGGLRFLRSRDVKKIPEGWSALDDRIGHVSSYSTKEKGFVKRGDWIGPDPYVDVLHRYLKPGLLGRGGALGGVADIAQGVNNRVAMANVALSGFHAFLVAMNSSAGDLIIAGRKAGRGEVGSAVFSAARALAPFASAIDDFILSKRGKLEYLRPGSQDPETGRLIDAYVAGGGRARMAEVYRPGYAREPGSAMRNVWDKFKQGKVGAVWGAPAALLEAASYPIMEVWVPRVKLGAAMKMLQLDLEKYQPRTPQELRHVAGQALDSVDNRYGQMVTDNLNWPRWLRDTMTLAFRFVDFNYGSLREMYGGILDIPSGLRSKEVSHRTAFIVAYPVMMAYYGTMVGFLLTSKWPWESDTPEKDMFFPRDGTLDAHGRPNRIVLPSYVRTGFQWGKPMFDVLKGEPFRAYQDAFKAARGRESFLVGLLGDLQTNEDFWQGRREIVNHDAPLVQQVWQFTKHMAGEPMPMGIRYALQAREAGEPGSRAALRAVGFGPAPAEFKRTEAENRIVEFSSGSYPQGPVPAEEADLSQHERQLINRFMLGEVKPQEISKAIEDGSVRPAKLVNMLKGVGTDPIWGSMAKRLSPRQFLEVWKTATPEERTKHGDLLPTFLRKLSVEPPQTRDEVLRKFKEQSALDQPEVKQASIALGALAAFAAARKGRLSPQAEEMAVKSATELMNKVPAAVTRKLLSEAAKHPAVSAGGALERQEFLKKFGSAEYDRLAQSANNLLSGYHSLPAVHNLLDGARRYIHGDPGLSIMQDISAKVLRGDDALAAARSSIYDRRGRTIVEGWPIYMADGRSESIHPPEEFAKGAQALIKAIQTAVPEQVRVYRGEFPAGSPLRQQQLQALKPGDIFEIDRLTSFADAKQVAESFSGKGMHSGGAEGKFVFETVGPVKRINIAPMSAFEEQEALTFGRWRVEKVSVESTIQSNPSYTMTRVITKRVPTHTRIVIRQLDTFEREGPRMPPPQQRQSPPKSNKLFKHKGLTVQAHSEGFAVVNEDGLTLGMFQTPEGAIDFIGP